MKPKVPSLAACLVCLCSVTALSAEVKVHPVPDVAGDSPYSVTAGGVAVPVEKAGASEGAYYARFVADETAAVTVNIRGNGVRAACKPAAEGFRADGGTLRLAMESNARHIVTANAGGRQLWPLILISEPEIVEVPEGRIFDIKNYLEKGAKIQTKGIQKALDDCAKEGGTVFFGPGVYPTGTIRIGSNTTVYLAPGALILGSANPADYPVDAGRREVGTHGPVCSFSRLIHFENAKNSGLTGHGVIDGRGHIVRNKHKRHVQLVDVTGCEYLQIGNVVLRNSAEWTFHILGSKDITIENLSIINDWGVENTDGIDPDGSVDVSVTNYLAYCGDDAVAIKTTGNSGILKPVMGVTVADSVMMTKKTALKVGTETYADISGVRFLNCKVVNSSRGCAVYARDGGKVSDVSFEDILLDLREFKGEDKSGEPVRLDLADRGGLGSMENIAFRNIVCRTPWQSVMFAHPKSNIRGVSFENFRIELANRTSRRKKVPLFLMRHCSGVSFKDVSVDRKGADPALWGAFAVQDKCTNVTKEKVDPGAAEEAPPAKPRAPQPR